jgi:PleD family two-component response regulator
LRPKGSWQKRKKWANKFFIDSCEIWYFSGVFFRIHSDGYPQNRYQQLRHRYRRKTNRVLVADDEFAARKLLGQILKGFGFEVVDLVKDGNEFIQRFWEIPIDIGFLDYNMPHKNGLSTAKDIMKGDPRALLVYDHQFQ